MSAHQEFLTDAQVAEFKRNGFVFVPAEQMWTPEEIKHLIEHVSTMDSWPEKAGHWMKYFEKNLNAGKPGHENENPRILQRIENFLQYNEPLSHLVNSERFLKMVGQLFGEEAILYKEKINYKLPGGDGFKPHQDHAAGWWMYGQTLHISALIGVDPATVENGALELVRGEHNKGLLGDQWKEVPQNLCDEWQQQGRWEMFPTKPGDVVFFDSYAPHRSGPNNTDKSRRIVYVTYAKKSEGDFRERYYADKRKSFPPDIERDPDQKYEYKI